ncbi:MAG TPA: response regulator transcription factor [Agitococcus sp.]|nr:response regulator transcription factor [Agitococcus sp.]HMV61017.1 response regulator transcription factor [Agitococcus sp.]HMX99148.1 response regulator transcription factor [Agitococcus sp.]HMY28285.1 response regulator transcription factor [Agitococcus sp.]HNC02677.1 response regulator transcription factor [Agitococcus sp.]
MIRILLVDDHTLFRSGISALLASQDDIDVVGEAGEGSEALKLVQTLQPDIMLLDLNMPGLSGLEVLKLTLEDNPQQAVIMLTLSEESSDLLRALQLGAKGYLLKNSNVDYLVNALRLVAQGGTAVHPDMTSYLVAGLRQLKKDETEEKEPLTPREKEVLQLVSTGQSNKEIARKLDIGESTVKFHIQSILRKLNLTSRVQAAVYASQHKHLSS